MRLVYYWNGRLKKKKRGILFCFFFNLSIPKPADKTINLEQPNADTPDHRIIHRKDVSNNQKLGHIPKIQHKLHRSEFWTIYRGKEKISKRAEDSGPSRPAARARSSTWRWSRNRWVWNWSKAYSHALLFIFFQVKRHTCPLFFLFTLAPLPPGPSTPDHLALFLMACFFHSFKHGSSF